MQGALRERLTEALVGLAVVLLALWFVAFAWQRTGGGGGSGSAVHVTALFPNASGIGIGTDVRIAGLKVGSVAAQKLDPKTWQAEVVLALDPATRVPADSTAVITSEGLLGGTYIQLVPGADETPLKNGDTIVDTQGSLDLMSLIGQFINRTGDDKGSSPGGSGSGMEASPTPGK